MFGIWYIMVVILIFGICMLYSIYWVNNFIVCIENDIISNKIIFYNVLSNCILLRLSVVI